ncbi:MAG TPA: hypothetical protein VF789_00425 [Thermoanaerobaculia bacterium]
MNAKKIFIIPALLALAACAGSPGPVVVPNSLTPGAPGGAAFGRAAATPAVDAAASARAVREVETTLPSLRGVPPGQQLRTLRWMLSVGDDRRLASLFPDLQQDTEETLERRGATARQRLEDLADGLERAGHQAPDPEDEVARVDPDAPAPNYFPPSMLLDLERLSGGDPEAARALEEVRRASPRGSRPPGR